MLNQHNTDELLLINELIDHANDMILIFTLHPVRRKTGKTLRVNKLATQKLGFSEKELLQMNPRDIFDDNPLIFGKEEAGLQPDSTSFETVLTTKNRKKIYTEVNSHMIRKNDRLIYITIARDITGRRKKELSLKQSESRYKRLVESLSDEYIFYSHNRKGIITYVSPSIRKVLGYSPEETYRDFRKFLTGHPINKQSRVHSEFSLKGIPQPPFENELYHRDGSTRRFYNVETPIMDEQGKVIAVEGIAHDITEKRKTEEELRKNQQILHLLEQTIDDVFWIFDLEKDKLLYVSPNYLKVYGQSADTLYRKPGSFVKKIHKDDVEQVKMVYRKLSKGIPFDEEYRIIVPGEGEKWIWSRTFITRNRKNKPHLVIGKSVDISGRKKIAQEKDLLASIVENTEDHAVIKDLKLRIIASNRANLMAAGKKSMEELTGKTDLEIYGDHPHVSQYMQDDLRAQKLKKGEFIIKEQEFVYPSGKKIISLVRKFPVFDENNQLIATASISRDISDYKRALEQLHASEEKYRLLLHSQGEGVGLIDERDRFVFVNPRAGEIFGVKEGSLKGKSLKDFLDKKNARIVEQKTSKELPGGRESYELMISRPDGEKKYIQVTATPQFKDEKYTGTFGVFMDITQRKQTEIALKESEKQLKNANAAKDKFFSIIAHDLKNPFNSIIGFTQLLLENYSSFDQETMLKYIKLINDSSTLAHNLLENLLEWSRVQTGSIRFNPAPFDIHNLTGKILPLFDIVIVSKNLKINNKTESLIVHADKNMISTVLRNLISNAAKFTGQEGRITISASRLKNMAEITVSDTGTGIPEKDIPKLFRIDVHFTTTGTSQETGTGLGLILCKQFVEKNNGEIWIKSKQGRGTKTGFTLPLAEIKEKDTR